jgi:hypothetical protein
VNAVCPVNSGTVSSVGAGGARKRIRRPSSPSATHSEPSGRERDALRPLQLAREHRHVRVRMDLRHHAPRRHAAELHLLRGDVERAQTIEGEAPRHLLEAVRHEVARRAEAAVGGEREAHDDAVGVRQALHAAGRGVQRMAVGDHAFEAAHVGGLDADRSGGAAAHDDLRLVGVGAVGAEQAVRADVDRAVLRDRHPARLAEGVDQDRERAVRLQPHHALGLRLDDHQPAVGIERDADRMVEAAHRRAQRARRRQAKDGAVLVVGDVDRAVGRDGHAHQLPLVVEAHLEGGERADRLVGAGGRRGEGDEREDERQHARRGTNARPRLDRSHPGRESVRSGYGGQCRFRTKRYQFRSRSRIHDLWRVRWRDARSS